MSPTSSRSTLVDARGALLTCSRTSNRRAVLAGDRRLRAVRRDRAGHAAAGAPPQGRAPRDVACVDDLPELFDRRDRDGYEYGDCQFATDPRRRSSCRRASSPATGRSTTVPGARRPASLGAPTGSGCCGSPTRDKARAFAEYARYYMSTDGQLYWSDTHQLARYRRVSRELDPELGATVKGSEMISELYVPRADLPEFMAAVRADARRHGDRTSSTARSGSSSSDDETRARLGARALGVCRVQPARRSHAGGHRQGAARLPPADRPRRELGGSYYLTYHRWATRSQVDGHPRMREFLAESGVRPRAVFTSDWYTPHVRLLGRAGSLLTRSGPRRVAPR